MTKTELAQAILVALIGNADANLAQVGEAHAARAQFALAQADALWNAQEDLDRSDPNILPDLG